MSKWEQVAKTTDIISKGLNDIWDQKLRKDASVIASDSWSNFVLDSSNFLTDAQKHIDVSIDQKTGTLACLMNMPDNHRDYDAHNQPFSSYALGGLKSRADALTESTKNPYAKQLLQDKISNYKTNIANQIAGYEANIVLDKRQNMAIENIEKLAKATYTNPDLYISNKEDALLAINSLDIDAAHKAKLVSKARSEISKAAANAVLDHFPATILDSNIHYEWKQDLDASSFIKLQRSAHQAINHANAKNINEFEQLSKIHFKSILDNGRGIDGIELKLSSLPESLASEFIIKEQRHIKAHDILEEIKNAPISDESRIMASHMNTGTSEEGYMEQVELYKIIKDHLGVQKNTAIKDPALFVEKLFCANNVDDNRELGEKIIDRIQWQKQKGIPYYRQKMLTNEEREEFVAALSSRDVNVIQDNLNNILQIEFNHEALGHKIIEEILLDTKLPTLTHFYIDAHLHSKGNLKKDLAKAMASGQALGEMSSDDQQRIQIRIDEHISSWKESTLIGNTDKAPEVNLMNAALLELARFYQFEKHLRPEKATDMAIKNLFEESYITPYKDWSHGKFYVPKTLLDDKEIIELDHKNINFNLKKLRADIINHGVQYDIKSSFGKEYYKGETLDSHAVNYALRNGAFRLSKDKKSVYYVYFDDKMEYPLLQSNKEIFTIDLIKLHKVKAMNHLSDLDLFQEAAGI